MRTLLLVLMLGGVLYLGAQSNSYQDQLTVEQTKVKQVTIERDMVNGRVTTLEQENAGLESKYNEVVLLVQSLEKERREQEEQINALNRSLDSVTVDRDRLIGELAVEVTRNGELSTEAVTLRQNLTEKEQILAGLQALLEDMKAQQNRRDLELAGARERVLELEALVAAQANELAALRQQVDELTLKLNKAYSRPLVMPGLLPVMLLAGGGLPAAAYGMWHRRRAQSTSSQLSRLPETMSHAEERNYYHAICLAQRQKGRSGPK